jgi:hypothetical protein
MIILFAPFTVSKKKNDKYAEPLAGFWFLKMHGGAFNLIFEKQIGSLACDAG